ncbi:MAG TPA: damage-inducible protein DinB, partial [Terriglobales bacterium]
MKYDFLVETYATERVKVVSVWSEFHDSDLPFRPNGSDPRGRSFHEQMVHQCVSENLWFMNMFGIDVGAPPLP